MSMVQLALKRPYTFIVTALLIVLATPFALLNMATDDQAWTCTQMVFKIIYEAVHIRACDVAQDG